ncbi:MAG: pantoate--beta-alanine ligase [Bacteroidia bacterium]|nr:pantoate--beta-alanine ligase [Bacteroidia bacterium]
MKICKNIAELNDWLENYSNDKSLGFVPTMGALHKGHISLLEQSIEDNDLSVVSIYVNPTQFDKKEDLENYPKNDKADAEMLEKAGCDMLFLPDNLSIYPNGEQILEFDLDGLDSTMEGKYRPGHFQGVITVVDRLLDLIQPDMAYFGEKDYQQLAIVRFLAEERHPETEIVGGRIIREPDGLAMSSRNERLSEEQKEAAAIINEVLEKSYSKKGNMNVEAITAWVRKNINLNPHLNVEYVEIIDPYTIEILDDIEEDTEARICVSVWCGDIRLIDNMPL